MSARYPIPAAALDDRLGFIGTSGSGKTYNAGAAVEHLLRRRARVVIVDPLGVWWGLRLLADGKTQSAYDVAIFGGPRGDLPLTEHAGALIGETAATMAESCIIDLTQLGTKSAERRFMTAFLEAIYRKASGEPFHLVVDEADLFAPQKPPKGDETLLNLMEQIVRRGRVKGFIPWLISQRPAVLNKNVLSQVDGLIAFKLTASQDRDALDGWIEGQAEKAQGKAIKDALPAMQIGQGVVWVPGRGVLETAAFPAKETYDSSRTPKRGEKRRTAELKPVNIDALKAKLATVETEAKANDPKALKAEIARLTAELKKAPKNITQKITEPDPAAIAKAEERGFEQAKKQLAAAADHELQVAKAALLQKFANAIGPLTAILKDELRTAHGKPQLAKALTFTPAPAPRAAVAQRAIQQNRTSPAKSQQGNGHDDHTLTGPQRQLMASLAWWKAMGHERPTRVQVASIAGWRVTSGHLKNVAGSLRSKGLIDYPSDGAIALTAEGEAAAPAPDTSMTLVDSVRAILSGPQRVVFDNLPANGAALTRDEIAQACGWETTSGHVKNVLGSMRSLEVIDYPSQGQVARAEWVAA